MQVEPGLWELTYTLPDPFGGESLRQVLRACVRSPTVTQDRVNSQMKGCRISNTVFRGAGAWWNMKCETSVGVMSGKGSARGGGSAVAGSAEMSLATIGGIEIPVIATFQAKRIGACR